MNLRIEELAKLLGKTRTEVEEMLTTQDVIELNLSERKTKYREEDDFRIFE
ncbi:hypothetical protein HYX05_02130 [Candidatus Woesearchaeota archaeon]|nr:hypothetical protein [Candidatus Woesearchaeota archaeon]